MARNNQRGSRNNNPEGRNQYNNGWVDTAKERPMATAAAAAAAVGAGVFLWSRRNQISEQISSLSGQISDWADDMRSGSLDSDMEMAGASTGSSSMGSSTSRRMGSSTSTGSGSNRSSSSRGRGSTSRATGGQSSTAGANMDAGNSGTSGITE